MVRAKGYHSTLEWALGIGMALGVGKTPRRCTHTHSTTRNTHYLTLREKTHSLLYTTCMKKIKESAHTHVLTYE